MTFIKNNKRDYLVLSLLFILFGGLIFLLIKNNELNNRLELSQNQLELSQNQLELSQNQVSKYQSLLSQNELLLEIDSLILELIINEKNIGKDSLRAMFLNLPTELYKSFIDSRSNSYNLINNKTIDKDRKFQSTLSKVNNLIRDYNRLKENDEKSQFLITELEEKNIHTAELNQNLLIKKIDSLRAENIRNLNVVELSKNGNTVYYIGSKEDDMPNGYGVGLWSTGGIYKGEWKNGLRDGTGIYLWNDGEVYEGQWKEGLRTGQGKYIWKDKQSYVGEWLENKRHGFGSIYYPNGKLVYEGKWENDKFKQPNKTNEKDKN